jgi:peptide/nickel transport system permease protein
VAEVIGDRLWLTTVVAVSAQFPIWLIVLPVGIYSAVRQYSVGNYMFTTLGFIGLAAPNFLPTLVYLGFRWFGLGIGGLSSPELADAPWSWPRVWDFMRNLSIPACVFVFAGTAQLVRIMHANLLGELRRPYVTTTRAKGLPKR